MKSFLRKYSEFLGLDLEDEINELEIRGYSSLESYTARESVKENLEMTQFSKKNQRYRKAEKSKGSPVFLVGSVVALLSALAGFYYMGSQANSPEAGARDILKDFESKKSSFSRDHEAKERLVSEKRPISPIKTSETASTPLASTRSVGARPSIMPKMDPMDSLYTDSTPISKPDVKTLKVPNLDSAPSAGSDTSVKPRELSPLFEY